MIQRLKPGEDDVDGPRAIGGLSSDKDQTVIKYADDDSKDDIDERTATVLAPRADGLVREMKTQKVVSREEIQERTETEDVKHFGDFTDEVRLNKGFPHNCQIAHFERSQKLFCVCGFSAQYQLTITARFREFHVDDHRWHFFVFRLLLNKS